MKTSDFDYELPPRFIAQTPVEPRDSSRLLILHRDTSKIEHAIFRDIGDFLKPGDILVLNKTRVIPARLYARKPTGGRIELLLLKREDLLTWEALVGGKGMDINKQVIVEGGPCARVVDVLEGSRRRICFDEPIEPHFPNAGYVPLPPYIHEELTDPERYQTIFAQEPGSAAAPTAGLHFTSELMERLQAMSIRFAYITLHVGLDTFAPITEADPSQHRIHTEWCDLSQTTVDAIKLARREGGRIIAVGTTSVRTLESASGENGISPYSGYTNIFIAPGYRFQSVDALITNFHLPKSTLIMLVSAFAGREVVLNAYKNAQEMDYRFYSFGDAMLIL